MKATSPMKSSRVLISISAAGILVTLTAAGAMWLRQTHHLGTTPPLASSQDPWMYSGEEDSSYGDKERTDQGASAREKVQEALQKLAGGKGDLKPLAVTYDGIHGLYGGLWLTIHGSGKVEQRVVQQKAGKPKEVTREELIKLAALLVQHKAWEQRVPEREPLPDEGQAELVITYEDSTVRIWEWFNDLEKNQRIDKIRAYMQEVAWKAPPEQ